jgi:hypothetical protein
LHADVVPVSDDQVELMNYGQHDPKLYLPPEDIHLIPAQDVACGYFQLVPSMGQKASVRQMVTVWDDPMLVKPIMAQKSLNVYCKINASRADDPEFLSSHTAISMVMGSCFPALAKVQTAAGK